MHYGGCGDLNTQQVQYGTQVLVRPAGTKSNTRKQKPLIKTVFLSFCYYHNLQLLYILLFYALKVLPVACRRQDWSEILLQLI